MHSGGRIGPIVRNYILKECQKDKVADVEGCIQEVGADLEEQLASLCNEAADKYEDVVSKDCQKTLGNTLWSNPHELGEDLISVADLLEDKPLKDVKAFIKSKAASFKQNEPPPSPPDAGIPLDAGAPKIRTDQGQTTKKKEVRKTPDGGAVAKVVPQVQAETPIPPEKPQEPPLKIDWSEPSRLARLKRFLSDPLKVIGSGLVILAGGTLAYLLLRSPGKKPGTVPLRLEHKLPLTIDPRALEDRLRRQIREIYPKTTFANDVLHAAVRLGLEEVWRAGITADPLKAAEQVVEGAMLLRRGTSADDASIKLGVEDIVKATDIIIGKPIRSGLRRSLLERSHADLAYAETIVVGPDSEGNPMVEVKINAIYIHEICEREGWFRKLPAGEKWRLAQAIAEIWNTQPGIRTQYSSPNVDFAKAAFAFLRPSGAPEPEDTLLRPLAGDSGASRAVLRLRGDSLMEIDSAQVAAYVRAGQILVEGSVEIVAGQLEFADRAKAERLFYEFKALSQDQQAEWIQKELAENKDNPKFNPSPGELPRPFIEARLNAPFDAITARANLVGHPEFDGLPEAQKMRVAQEIAEVINRDTPAAADIRASLKEGWRLSEDQATLFLRRHAHTPPSSKRGGGPDESGPQGSEPPIVDEGGKGKKRVLEVIEGGKGVLKRSSQPVGLLDGLLGFASGATPLLLVDVGEHERWITPKAQTTILGGWFAGMTYYNPYTPSELALMSAPFDLSRITTQAALKKVHVSDRSLTYRVGGTLGGLAGTAVIVHATGGAQVWHQAAQNLQNGILAKIGKAGMAIEVGLASAWQSIQVGVQIYGGAMLNTAGAFVTPIMVIGNLSYTSLSAQPKNEEIY